ncbi:MAG: glycosyltransferase family 9 protein [Acidobacteriota bacterium]
MRFYGDYKNHSRKARIIAWLMDLILAPVYRILSQHFLTGAFADRKSDAHEKIEKILLVRLDHIGDLLMATPAIAALRKKFPEARIDLLGGESAKAIFKGNPYIDHVYTFDATWYDPRRGGEIWPVDVAGTVLRLRRIGYDVAVDLRGDFRVIFLFLWLAGARRRIGFRDLGLGFLLTDSTGYDLEKPYMDINFDALSLLGIDRSDRRTRFYVPAEDEAFVDSLLAANGIKWEDHLIGINPTTNRVEQRWHESKFAELCDRLIETFGVKVIFVAAGSDSAVVELVRKEMKRRSIDLSGKIDLNQLGALLKKCILYIANDSGPMHLSISLGTPTIGIFGTTSVKRSWPYGSESPFFKAISAEVDCPRPCYRNDCEDRKCFDLITVDQVYQSACGMLKRMAEKW